MLTAWWAINACQSTLIPISKRRLDTQAEQPPRYIRKSRSIGEPKTNQSSELFLRQKKTAIVPLERQQQSASLFQVSNPQNYLFYDKPRGEVGDMIPVYVRPERKAPDSEDDTEPLTEDNAEMDAEQLEKDLLAALPDLRPQDDKPVPVTKIPFKVMRILPDGDAIVENYRVSKNDDESNVVKIQARVPKSRLMSNEPILTTDLRDINWYQNRNQNVTERQSLGWQDEYTLRLSGFEEARSLQAKNLEQKRQDLIKLRDRLKQRIMNLSKERSQVARERSRLTSIKDQYDSKIQDLENQIQQKAGEIDEQKAMIQRQRERIRQLEGDSEQPAEQAEEAQP
jgi:hypothetical protein